MDYKMDYTGTSSMESVLNRLSAALEGIGDGFLEHPAIPYTINQLLETAIDNRASMLHINVGSPPMLRINDQLVPIGEHQLTRGDCQKLLHPLLTREQRSALYSGIEIDGCFPSSGTGFRLNLYKERGNLSASIRRLRSDIPSLDTLGLSGSAVEHVLTENSGLVLLTGMPRSGKLNTLAAFIAHLNATRNARIISLEKPIKYWHQKSLSTVVQREIGIDTRSFAHGLQQAVLQDPDIISLTNLPDRETAEFVIRAASGGHLVLAALDATSCTGALERLYNTFSRNEMGTKIISALAGTLKAVICQTLVPSADNSSVLPAFEIMIGSDAIRSNLRDGNIERLQDIMRDENMQTLGKALSSLVNSGAISQATAVEYLHSPEELSTAAQDGNHESDNDQSAPPPIIPDSAVTDPSLAWL